MAPARAEPGTRQQRAAVSSLSRRVRVDASRTGAMSSQQLAIRQRSVFARVVTPVGSALACGRAGPVSARRSSTAHESPKITPRDVVTRGPRRRLDRCLKPPNFVQESRVPHSPRAFWVVAGSLAATLMSPRAPIQAPDPPSFRTTPPPPPKRKERISRSPVWLPIDVKSRFTSRLVEYQESAVDTRHFLWTSGSVVHRSKEEWHGRRPLSRHAGESRLIFTVIERYKGLDTRGARCRWSSP